MAARALGSGSAFVLPSLDKGDRVSATMSILAAILCVMVVALIVANGYVYWRSRPRPAEPIYHFNCPNPNCRQRLRYRARQVGHPGMCPRCKERWNFPAIPEPTSSPHRASRPTG
jgi:hypothetical protein